MEQKIYFVVPGVQKGGTTYLYEMLRQHPEIFLSQTKELDHFTRSTDVAAYEANFSNAHDAKCYGDISPQYLSDDVALERIAAYRPDAKLIILLRHPIERMISHLQMELKRGLISSLEDVLDLPEVEIRDTYYYKNSNYVRQLKTVRQHFPEDQILIVKSEILSKHSAKTLKKMFKFLGLTNHQFVPYDVNGKVHQAGEYRFKAVPLVINFLQARLRTYKKLVYRIIPKSFLHWIVFKIETGWNTKRSAKQSLTDAQSTKLGAVFKESLVIWHGIPDV